MDKLVLNTITKRQLEQFLQKPSHSLLIIGPAGSGKQTIALHIAAQLLQSDIDRVGNHPHVKLIAPLNSSISIDVIRDLKSFSKLKTAGHSSEVKRIVIVYDAQALTTEAQNAFLKLLEEPPADTVLVLTTTNHQLLLPTIISRTQQLHLKPINKQQLIRHFTNQNYPLPQVEKAYHISGGRVGLMQAILSSEDDHDLLVQVQNAKDILISPVFDRLTKVDGLAKQKDELRVFLEGLHRVTQAALTQAIEKDNMKQIERWKSRLQLVHEAIEDLAGNANAKLTLTHLFMGL